MGLEYEFALAVPVANSNSHHAIGYMNFRVDSERPRSGSLAELLKAGQTHLAHLEGGFGKTINDAQVDAEVTETGAVRLRLVGSEWIRQVFDARPESGLILINTPEQERTEHPVTIQYVDS